VVEPIKPVRNCWEAFSSEAYEQGFCQFGGGGKTIRGCVFLVAVGMLGSGASNLACAAEATIAAPITAVAFSPNAHLT